MKIIFALAVFSLNVAPANAENWKKLDPAHDDRMGLEIRGRKPFVDVSGRLRLPSFRDEFVAADPRGHSLRLLAQILSFLNEPIFKAVNLFDAAMWFHFSIRERTSFGSRPNQPTEALLPRKMASSGGHQKLRCSM